jgi:hypothetical protein
MRQNTAGDELVFSGVGAVGDDSLGPLGHRSVWVIHCSSPFSPKCNR